MIKLQIKHIMMNEKSVETAADQVKNRNYPCKIELA